MITFAKSYKTSDDQIFGTVEGAQEHELQLALTPIVAKEALGDVVRKIIAQKDLIVDILTTTPNSKPKARSLHGGTKKRPSKTIVTDAATSVTSVANASQQ